MNKNHKNFVRLKAAQESQGSAPVGRRPHDPRTMRKPRIPAPRGAMINGPDLAKIQPLINEIPDRALARRISGQFSIFPKYQVLSMLINERSEALKRFPDAVNRIVETASEVDFKTSVIPTEVLNQSYDNHLKTKE